LRTPRDADLILLNEVDLGTKRTDYRDVARELAHALGMNYVFGVEFVEVDRLDDLGLEKVQLEDPELAQKMREELKPIQHATWGFTGTAFSAAIRFRTPGLYGFRSATIGNRFYYSFNT